MHASKSVLTTVALVCAWFAMASPAWAQRMHYLGIAASNRETVFRSEVTSAGATLATVWPLASSQITSGDFLGGVTYATVRAQLGAVASRMDREKDVLFLLVSSHGAPGGRGIELSGGGLMTAGMLRSALDAAGIRNRIILISACYSGQFIGPLAGPNAIVITAANATNPSFGCTNQREATYFGDAFFNYGLKQSGRDLRRAFLIARTTVTAWERRDNERPSQPQLTLGPAVTRLLRTVQ